MAATIDNAVTATQKGDSLSSTSYRIRDSQSVTLAALAGRASRALTDGHARPSIFAVTPATSTKLAELMGTLRRACLPDRRASSAPMNVTSRCNVAFPTRRVSVTTDVTSGHLSSSTPVPSSLFSTRVPRKESRKSSSVNKTAIFSRYTFGLFHNPFEMPEIERKLCVPEDEVIAEGEGWCA
jgi:hypothetical protein